MVVAGDGSQAYINSGNVGIGTTSPSAKLHINGAAAFVKVTHDAPGATETIDWTTSNKQEITLDTAATTITFTAPGAPCNVILMIKNTSSRTITWPATVKWAGGTAPTLSSGATDIDIIGLYFDGTNYYAVASQDFS